MLISSNFDSGSIEVIDATNPRDVRLSILRDHPSEWYQWFHFRVSGVMNEPCKFTIERANETAFPDGWEHYNVCASYDRDDWFRVASTYSGESLSWEITPEQDSIYFAYYVPYSMERHLDLIAACSTSPLVKSHVLGHTLDGQDLDMLEIGHDGEGRKSVWLIARQHPGESMSEWWMEGALERLLDEDDPIARKLLEKANFYLVPNMNPDGSRRGQLRTNACGTPLNREWLNPSMERSPEVFLTRKKMQETGVDFFIDVHGDEGLPYCFVAGFHGVPNLRENRIEQFRKYRHTLARLCPDFQEVHGYDADEPGAANMNMALNYIADHFDAVTMIMETPFQDNHDLPDAGIGGFSTERCRHLARGSLAALLQIIDEI
ncbi:MAG: carboxypeptidase family protein [Gammaproteobacteria bacterium]|nr:carboxypeptidase family protein [Gammaproteobacteria bacterium]